LPGFEYRITRFALISATCEAGRRIRDDAPLTHRLGEILAPMAQHVLINMQPAAVLAFGFDDHVDMGVFLVGVEHHCVPVLEGELLEREFPSGGQDFVWGRGGGHRKNDVVDELRATGGRASVPWVIASWDMKRREPMTTLVSWPVCSKL
jgi:hypothetical protein